MCFRYFIIFCFVVSFSNIFGQTSVDSLQKRYYNQKGLEKIETGLILCDELEDEPEKMLGIANELQQKLTTVNTSNLLYAKVLKKVSDAWYFNDSLIKSTDYLLKSLEITESLNPKDESFLAELYNDLGLNYNELEKYSLADFYLNKALYLFKKLNLTPNIADVVNNLGSMYHDKGDYEKALTMFLEAYELDIKSGNKKAQSSSLNNIGQMYVKLGKFELGLDKYQESLNLVAQNEASTKAVRYNNMGMAYQLMGQHQSALKWFEAALKIDIQEKNGLKIGVRKHNIATSYLALGNYDKAEKLLLESAKSFETLKTNNRLAKVYGNLGEVYKKQKRLDRAEEFFKKALLYSEQADDLAGKQEVYGKLYQFYKENHNPEKALQFFEKQTRAKDSIFTLKLLKEVEELQTRYEAEKKDQKIHLLSQDNKLKSELLQYRKRQRNVAIIGLAVTVFFLLGLYSMYSTVKQQRRELALQNAQLEKLNNTQNKLFGIISHDLKNAFASYQSYIKIIEHHLTKNTPEKLTPLLPDLRANSGRLSTLLDNLLHWAVLQIKGIQPEFESIKLQEEFEILAEIFRIKTVEKSIEMNLSVQDETVFCDRESLRLILRNLVENAIKYTENGRITVQAVSHGNQTKITIADTGSGIPTDIQHNLFTWEKDKVKAGTKGEKGVGLGLSLVAEHLKKNHGTIELKKSDTHGTKFVITLNAFDHNTPTHIY